MPIYEYKCLNCGKHHEIMRKITDRPLSKCPDCSGKMKKMISNTSFVLKGTGWYATDYASDKKKNADSSRKTPKDESPKTETPNDTKTEGEPKKDIKTEAKPVSKEAAV
jgi:putative FmdB family regulatory protein